jgi:hypothetical protein
MTISPWPAKSEGGVNLELDEALHLVERVAKEKPGALGRAEQIRYHGEIGSPDMREEEGRPTRAVDAAMDGRGLKVRIDLVLNSDNLPCPRKIGNTGLQVSVAHILFTGL